MKTRGGMEITGFDGFKRRLAQAIKEHSAATAKAISEIGDLGILGSVEFCPVDEGNLTESIEKFIESEAGTLVAVIRVPLNTPAADYAVRLHEDQYNPGPKSRKKAAKLGHDVGRKYILKGIQSQQENFLIVLKKHLTV